MNRLSRISEQKLSSNQKKIVLLCFFGSLTILIAIFSGPHGPFVIDEGTYHLMARSFAESGNLAVWNGYEEFPSAELVLPLTRVYEGQLVPQYPYLSAVLNYPFYRLAGFEGLIRDSPDGSSQSPTIVAQGSSDRESGPGLSR